MSLQALERATGSLEIMVHLYFRGATAKTALARLLKRNHEALGRTVRTLRRLQLVEIENEESFPYRQLCVLTPAGRALVESPVYRWPSLLWDSGMSSRSLPTNGEARS
jgi:DNA-binding HxlR family transcriptional regulator